MEGFITVLHQISGCDDIISLYHKQFQIEMQLFFLLRDTKEIESLRETIQSPNHPELWALAFKSWALISVHAYRPAKVPSIWIDEGSLVYSCHEKAVAIR